MLELGAQNRAFPTNPEKSGERVRLMVLANLALVLCFKKASLCQVLPVRQSRGEQAAESRREGRHLLPQISNETPAPERVLFHPFFGIGNKAPQPIQRREVSALEPGTKLG